MSNLELLLLMLLGGLVAAGYGYGWGRADAAALVRQLQRLNEGLAERVEIPKRFSLLFLFIFPKSCFQACRRPQPAEERHQCSLIIPPAGYRAGVQRLAHLGHAGGAHRPLALVEGQAGGLPLQAAPRRLARGRGQLARGGERAESS
jgi:hypothetical protein